MRESPLTSAPDSRLFVFCDLDGTVAPYGNAVSSPAARDIFHRLVSRPEIVLAYVTGRTMGEAKRIINEFDLPFPHFLAGDVGSTIERCAEKQFVHMQSWWDAIRRDWVGVAPDVIMDRLLRIPGLRLQEDAFQNSYKVCFYTDYEAPGDQLVNKVQNALLDLRIRSQVLHSRDDHRQVGYLDVLPLGAGKLGAVKWLLSQTGISADRALFAGDAGNDLPVLASGLRSVMPRNGQAQVRDHAYQILEKKERGLSKRLYMAKGGFLGLDGHVLGGVLEGIYMHFPQTREWMVS